MVLKKSMKEQMSTSHFLNKMSGLKVNEKKNNKAPWLGSMSKSQKKNCQEYDLDWEQEPIKILGVTFSEDVCNVWEHNADDILHKINRMIHTWSKRKLTLTGTP